METVDLAPLVHGAVELAPAPGGGLKPWRLPEWARRRCPDPQLQRVVAETSGVRVEMVTTARRVELVVDRSRLQYAGLAPRAAGAVDIVVDGEAYGSRELFAGTTTVVDVTTGHPEVDARGPEPVVVDLDGAEHRVELWLPWNEATELRSLTADGPIAPVPDDRPRWVHHGSSISHGSNATTPTTTWVALAARAAGVDVTNLGFGGSALLDPFVPRTIGALPADVISAKLGINVVNSDLMRRRAFGPAVHGFLDAVRDGHPDVPLLLVTPIWCPLHETTPGPGAFDPEAFARGEMAFTTTGDPAAVAGGALTLEVVREVLAEVVAQRDDPHLHLISGLDLYGPDDAATHPLPDRLHPGPATHAEIGARFARILQELLR
ncbi:SGNH/GDSL hydrolase family protein [Mariniluteicoccus endophyticus]